MVDAPRIWNRFHGMTPIGDGCRHAATCLNEFAAKVWRRGDGTTSVADIADALGEDERAVWLALHQLNKSKLLVEEIAMPPDMRTGKTRRQMGRQWADATAAAAADKIDRPHEPAVLIEPLGEFHWWRWYVKDSTA
jgi:hypothetical protein